MANASQLLNEYKKYNVNAYAKAIEDEYNKKTGFNKDLIDQKNQLQDQQIALPGQLRDEYYKSPIRNALAQESLIAGRQANVGSQLGSVTDLLNARGQQYSDILGKATTGYTNNMENAWRLYQDQSAKEENAKNRAVQTNDGLDTSNLKDSDGDGIPDMFDSTPNGGGNNNPAIPVTGTQNSPFINFANSLGFNKNTPYSSTMGKTIVERMDNGKKSFFDFMPGRNIFTGIDFYKDLFKNIKNYNK